jgi:metal-responsive CopG/Arc/MetJ family transcriptional regulator
VLISIECGLLSRADDAARQRHLSRSRLIAQGLEAVLDKAG